MSQTVKARPTKRIEVEAPKGAKILVLEIPANEYLTAKQFDGLAERVRVTFARQEWPVVLALYPGWSAHWLEAE